jgi:hypothetical protein
MSWLKNLFVSKKKMALREDTEGFFKRLCDAFKDNGEPMAISKEETRWAASSSSRTAPIMIKADWDSGEVYIFMVKTIFGYDYNLYLQNFLNGRRTNCVLYPEDWDEADTKAIAKEFHELAQEYRPVVEAIEKILERAAKERLEKIGREINEMR